MSRAGVPTREGLHKTISVISTASSRPRLLLGKTEVRTARCERRTLRAGGSYS